MPCSARRGAASRRRVLVARSRLLAVPPVSIPKTRAIRSPRLHLRPRPRRGWQQPAVVRMRGEFGVRCEDHLLEHARRTVDGPDVRERREGQVRVDESKESRNLSVQHYECHARSWVSPRFHRAQYMREIKAKQHLMD